MGGGGGPGQFGKSLHFDLFLGPFPKRVCHPDIQINDNDSRKKCKVAQVRWWHQVVAPGGSTNWMVALGGITKGTTG